MLARDVSQEFSHSRGLRSFRIICYGYVADRPRGTQVSLYKKNESITGVIVRKP